MDNYYNTLKVSNCATDEEIKKVIHRQLRIWSNRTNAPKMESRQEAERMVKILEEAQTVLLHPEKRKGYDQKLKASPTEPSTSKSDKKSLDSQENLVQAGWKLLIDGNVADAIYLANKATAADSENPEAWALLAQAKFRWGESADAIYEYKRAIGLCPNQSDYYFDLGSVYEATGKMEEALMQYQRASQIDPRNTMYAAAIGILILKDQRYDESIEILEKCVKQDPSNTTYQWYLAVAYSERTYKNWTFVGEGEIVPPGYYATKKEHVEEAQLFISKAQKMKCKDQELLNHIHSVKENIDCMMARKFNGNSLAAVAYMIGGFAMMEDITTGVFMVAISILYFVASRTRQYVINKEIIGGEKTSAQVMAEATADGQDGAEKMGGFLGSFIPILLFLPIMTIWNFVKNYLINK